MSQLQTIIIEDEPLASSLLEDYIARTPFLHLMATFVSPVHALQYLEENVVDVIFLDIHLPELNGLQFIARLRYSPQIILTTAYDQYALQSYDYAVTDYLLKPIEFERYEMAINKLDRNKACPSLLINVNKNKIRINVADITYLEACRDYLWINLTDKTRHKTKRTLYSILRELPSSFVQIHRSFIVNTAHISAFNRATVALGDVELPIGRKYKKRLPPALF